MYKLISNLLFLIFIVFDSVIFRCFCHVLLLFNSIFELQLKTLYFKNSFENKKSI